MIYTMILIFIFKNQFGQPDYLKETKGLIYEIFVGEEVQFPIFNFLRTGDIESPSLFRYPDLIMEKN